MGWHPAISDLCCPAHTLHTYFSSLQNARSLEIGLGIRCASSVTVFASGKWLLFRPSSFLLLQPERWLHLRIWGPPPSCGRPTVPGPPTLTTPLPVAQPGASSTEPSFRCVGKPRKYLVLTTSHDFVHLLTQFNSRWHGCPRGTRRFLSGTTEHFIQER